MKRHNRLQRVLQPLSAKSSHFMLKYAANTLQSYICSYVKKIERKIPIMEETPQNKYTQYLMRKHTPIFSSIAISSFTCYALFCHEVTSQSVKG